MVQNAAAIVINRTTKRHFLIQQGQKEGVQQSVLTGYHFANVLLGYFFVLFFYKHVDMFEYACRYEYAVVPRGTERPQGVIKTIELKTNSDQSMVIIFIYFIHTGETD